MAAYRLILFGVNGLTFLTCFGSRVRCNGPYKVGCKSVYCHMEIPGCGAGPWTLVMKIDGSKVRTHSTVSARVKQRHILGKQTIFSTDSK